MGKAVFGVDEDACQAVAGDACRAPIGAVGGAGTHLRNDGEVGVDGRQGLLDGIPGDLVASDVRQALHHLGSITGEIDPEDILDHIFANFCIGK